MHRVKYKVFAAVISLGIIVMALAGCGAASVERPEALAGAPTFEVTGSCDISVDGDTVTVSGETNIVDGALIDISVVGQNGMVIDNETVTKSGDTFSKTFTITGEKYDGIQSIVGYITFAPKTFGNQPDAVYRTYGDDFEYIDAGEGNYIWDKNGIIVMFASDMVSLAD